MFTFFTIPKAFEGQTGIHQRNALQSWRNTQPEAGIFIFGDDAGAAEAAAEVGARHFPEIRKTELNTPLLSDAFKQAAEHAQTPFLVYINSDIILLHSIPEQVGPHAENALIVGSRANIQWNEPIRFSGDWKPQIQRLAESTTDISRHGSDYFIFPRNSPFIAMPDFAVGRQGWDNWMIFTALKSRMRLIDASATLLVAHPIHGYNHIKKRESGNQWAGEESRQNMAMAGDLSFSPLDATHRLVAGKLRRNLTHETLLRKPAAFRKLHPGAPVRFLLLKALRGAYKQTQKLIPALRLPPNPHALPERKR